MDILGGRPETNKLSRFNVTNFYKNFLIFNIKQIFSEKNVVAKKKVKLKNDKLIIKIN